MQWYLAVFKKYAVFSGRARRKEYWIFGLIDAVIVFTLKGIEILVLRSNPESSIVFLRFLYAAGTLIPTIAVTVRRLHDTNRSGWWFPLILVPILGLYLLFPLAEDSQPGANRYGPNPKGIADSDTTAWDSI